MTEAINWKRLSGVQSGHAQWACLCSGLPWEVQRICGQRHGVKGCIPSSVFNQHTRLMTSAEGTTWDKGHHPLWETLCLLSSPWRSLSKACFTGLTSSFYAILWRLFNPPGGNELHIKGIAGCHLSSSSTSFISFFSLFAFSFTQKGKL